MAGTAGLDCHGRLACTEAMRATIMGSPFAPLATALAICLVAAARAPPQLESALVIAEWRTICLVAAARALHGRQAQPALA